MEHDERVKDILDKTEKLLVKKGYDNTTVADIIRKVGIAKGTFYHYFKSKDELLDAIIERIIQDISNQIDEIIENNELDAISKVLGFFSVFQKISKVQKILIENIHSKDAHIHLKFDKKMDNEITPKFEKIIRQGIDEGVFDTKYPAEAAKVTLASIVALTEIQDRFEGVTDLERVHMFYDFISRILGTNFGTFQKYINKKDVKK
jgi:AcrR family transcriptional regulator